MTTVSGEAASSVVGTRAFVDAMLAHTASVSAEIERAAAGLATADITGPVLDGVHGLAGHYAGARGRWNELGAALKQHEALAQQTRATHGAATDMTFYSDDTAKEAMTASAAPADADPGAEQETPIATEPAAPAAPRGTYNPGQPRAADGTWIKVGDELGYADGENVHATGQVIGAGPVPTTLALIDYPDDGVNQHGAFVEVATPKGGYNPVTGQEGDGNSYCPPQLGPDEAEAAAGRLEELATMVESGYRPPKPTVHTRARQRIEMLMADNRTTSRDRVIVGDQDDFPLTTGQLLKLLNEADPTLSAPQTRHAIRAHAAGAAGGEDGTLWLDMEPNTAGGMHIVVTAVEGTEDPDDDYNRQYAAQHTPDSARELAGKLRAFAGAARRRGRH